LKNERIFLFNEENKRKYFEAKEAFEREDIIARRRARLERAAARGSRKSRIRQKGRPTPGNARVDRSPSAIRTMLNRENTEKVLSARGSTKSALDKGWLTSIRQLLGDSRRQRSCCCIA
jgi:DNA invertase Pin-like site-specific DNA recombinase